MKKLVCVTPAGRRRYMKSLIPQILSSETVSRYDIWINTNNVEDIDFFNFLEKKFKKIRLVEQPDGVIDGNKSINSFFKCAMNQDEIYVRMDDDIVWIMPGFFEEIYNLRLKDLESFLISPLVINNSISTHIFQQENKFVHEKYLPAICMDELTWRNPNFAYNLHLWFLNILGNNSLDKLKTSDYNIALNRFSINSISWHGSDFNKFNGVVLGDEEEYLTVIKPAQLNKVNKIIGSLIVAHYSFFTQRELLDSTDLIDLYEIEARKTYADNLVASEIFSEIDSYFKSKSSYTKPRKYFDLSEVKKKILNIKVPIVEFKKINEII